METQPRLPDRDAELAGVSLIKILAMLLVVYCHSISIYMAGGWGPEAPARASRLLGLAASWLNTFHVHTFVAVSGYLFYYLRFETRRYDEPRHVLRNKALRLLLPYACASVLWVIPFDVLFWGFEPKRLFADYALALNPCQLWFLPMLFIVFAIFVFLCARVRFDALSPRASVIWLITLYAVSVAASVLSSAGVPNVFQLCRALQFLPYFYAGMLLRRTGFSQVSRLPYILAALLGSVALFAASQWLEGAGSPLSYVRIPLRPLGSLCGVLFLVLLGRRLARPAGEQNAVYRLLNRSMFPVYLFHQQFVYLVIAVLNRPNVAPYWLGEAAFAASLAFSLLLAWALGKWRVTKSMFGIG